jgi:hypothetical protein
VRDLLKATAMPTIIEQIQRDALDSNIPVSALLRRVKLAAAKLRLDVIEDWVDKELNGYTSNVPDYRILTGRPKGRNPLRGWIPVIGEGTELFSSRPNGQPVAALEDLIKGDGGMVLPNDVMEPSRCNPGPRPYIDSRMGS